MSAETVQMEVGKVPVSVKGGTVRYAIVDEDLWESAMEH